MNDDQPTQPLTDAELSVIRTRFDNRNGDMQSWGPVTLFQAAREVPRLLAEVDRLRAENDAHVRHLAEIRRTLSKAGAHGQPEASGVRQLARCAESLREENERLEDELETVTEENSAERKRLRP